MPPTMTMMRTSPELVHTRRSGESREHRGGGEDGQLIALDRAAEGAGAVLVLMNRRYDRSERRGDEPGESEVDGRGHRNAEERKMCLVGEVAADPGKIELRDAGETADPAENPIAREPCPTHLTEGKRHHDEEDAAEMDDEAADQQGDEPGQHDGGEDGERRRPFEKEGQSGKGIGAKTEEESVAERHHPAITDQEIETHREDRRNGDLAETVSTGIAREPPSRQRGAKQRPPDDAALERRCVAHAAGRAGKSPPGRSSSTSTITA